MKPATGDPHSFDAMLRKARRWVPIVLGVTRRSPIDPALVLAVIHTESGFDPMARSSAGACGLMQLIPEAGARTASAYLTGRRCSIPDAALFRPRLNILLGVAYLEWLWLRKFGRTSPDICRTLICVAAYNAGPNRISRWLTDLRRTEQPSLAAQDFVTDELLFTLTTTLPWRETRQFVSLVASHWECYRNWLGFPQAVTRRALRVDGVGLQRRE